MTITLSEKLKAASTELPPAGTGLALPRNADAGVEGISLRALSPSGEFSHAVKAFPGMVTVLQERGRESVRDALLGREGKLDLRVGTQELHRSEIYLVQSHEHLLREATVRDAIRAAGAPEDEAQPLLEKLGLQDFAGMAPRDLPSSALKRLAIGCSMYARARILLYDRPFSGSDPAWIERIAQLMLRIGEANARAMIVTGEASLPNVWRGNSRVLVQDPKGSSGQTLVSGKVNGSAVTVPQAARLVTRPQSIYTLVPHRPPEMMQSEAIANPKVALGGGAGASQLAVEGMQTARREGLEESQMNEYRRSKSGRLTRVNNFHRMQRAKVYRIVDEMMRKVRSRISARPAELDMPTSARLLEFTKRRELHIGTAIFILAVLAMCLIAYLNRH